jgi:hypothetical protein
MSTSTSNTFTVGSVTARYAREYHNEAYQNERSIEVALGRWFLKRYLWTDGDESLPVMEVGCVMPYYGESIHEITDLTDPHPASRKVDALTLDYTARAVLCISTIEHLNGREFGNQSDEDGIRLLQMITQQASAYLITWGVGYNPVLDTYVQAHPEIQRVIMLRTNWKNEYRQALPEGVGANGGSWTVPFGHSDRPIPQGYFNNANAVVLVTNVPELLAAAPEGAR